VLHYPDQDAQVVIAHLGSALRAMDTAQLIVVSIDPELGA
jgi:hypothetical protein